MVGSVDRLVAAAHVTSVPSPTRDRDIHVPVLSSPHELLARDDVDLVHIATPPASHYELALASIRAGKHVLCEKPLALDLDRADEMLEAARRAGVLLAVNYPMRYCPITELVKGVIDSRVLGGVLAAEVTNLGSDSGLGPGHWFWDKQISGGVFVEHAVHFFDLYSRWLGPGRVINAHSETRPDGREDRVTCNVLHEGKSSPPAIVGHYHSFDQPAVLDRTEHRIICEMGDIRISGWVPMELMIDAAVDDAGAAELARRLPDTGARVLEEFPEGRRGIMGRGLLRRATKRIRMEFHAGGKKQDVYAGATRAFVADQIAWIRDRRHPRRVTAHHARDSLALAISAAKMTEKDGKYSPPSVTVL